MRLQERVERLEQRSPEGMSRLVVAIQEFDDKDRVTGYRFGYGADEYTFARKDGEALGAFKDRLREHVGAAQLHCVEFVPAAGGKPAWRNGVGPV